MGTLCRILSFTIDSNYIHNTSKNLSLCNKMHQIKNINNDRKYFRKIFQENNDLYQRLIR